MDDKKVTTYTQGFLLLAASVLTLWGIWGEAYDWFTGARLVALLAMGAVFGQILAKPDNPFATYFVRGSALAAFLLGSHLLAPYFWPGRIHNMPLFVSFFGTALLSMWQLGKSLKGQALSGTMKCLCALPPTLMVGMVVASYCNYGNFYAPALLCLLYACTGVVLVRKGLQEASRLIFNAGIFLFLLILLALAVTFLLELPSKIHISIIAGLVIILNIFYDYLKQGAK